MSPLSCWGPGESECPVERSCGEVVWLLLVSFLPQNESEEGARNQGTEETEGSLAGQQCSRVSLSNP